MSHRVLALCVLASLATYKHTLAVLGRFNATTPTKLTCQGLMWFSSHLRGHCYNTELLG